VRFFFCELNGICIYVVHAHVTDANVERWVASRYLPTKRTEPGYINNHVDDSTEHARDMMCIQWVTNCNVIFSLYPRTKRRCTTNNLLYATIRAASDSWLMESSVGGMGAENRWDAEADDDPSNNTDAHRYM
jgi:hypothetical protein